jgi:hypothetical protein
VRQNTIFRAPTAPDTAAAALGVTVYSFIWIRLTSSVRTGERERQPWYATVWERRKRAICAADLARHLLCDVAAVVHRARKRRHAGSRQGGLQLLAIIKRLG